MGPRSEGCAEMGGGPACQRCHWNLRWSSLWGRGTCEGRAEICGGPACQRCHWILRWSSPIGNTGGKNMETKWRRMAPRFIEAKRPQHAPTLAHARRRFSVYACPHARR
eukprot:6992719-Pyramimonas_sp.AAC.1